MQSDAFYFMQSRKYYNVTLPQYTSWSQVVHIQSDPPEKYNVDRHETGDEAKMLFTC